METPSFEIPQPLAFSIPFNPNKLRFQSEFMDKQRFQKLNIDRNFLKALQPYLNEYVDKHTLFFLKGTGNGSGIQYQNNRVSYYKNLLNAGIPEWEYPNDANTVANYNFNETTGTTTKDETGVYPLSDGGVPTRNVSGKVLSPAVSIDGTDDYLLNNILLGDSYINGTIEMWFMPLANWTTRKTLWYKYPVIEREASCQFKAFTSGIDFYIYFAPTFKIASTTQTVWNANVWYHIANLWGTSNTWGSTGMKNIVDGVVDGVNAYTGANVDGNLAPFYLGAVDPTSFLTNMRVDLFRVSNTQRTQFGGISPQGVF